MNVFLRILFCLFFITPDKLFNRYFTPKGNSVTLDCDCCLAAFLCGNLAAFADDGNLLVACLKCCLAYLTRDLQHKAFALFKRNGVFVEFRILNSQGKARLGFGV